MSTRAPKWPAITSVELRGVIDAFRRRQRGLRHSWQRWECELDLSDGERLNLDFRDHDATDVRLSFWADGNMWFRACRGKRGRGWLFVWAFHGEWRLAEPEALVEMMKKSRLICAFPSAESEAELFKVWRAVKPVADR